MTAPPRVLVELRGPEPGPTLIVIGGVHGNEPEGIAAARAVLASIPAGDVRGEIVALVGNRGAVVAGRRHVGRDLNRMWTDEQVAAARAVASEARAPEVPEQRELVELAGVIDGVLARARGPVHLVDLHTTSAPGFPFAVVGPTSEHRRFAAAFPLPGIVGLEELLPGVLTGYLGGRCITLAIEGGQHATSAAADNLAAVITLALEASGVLRQVAGAGAARDHLRRVRGELPATIEVVERHAVRPDDGFRMLPGFANIQRTAAGTLLARDRTGEIRAPFEGVLLLPLYQPDGSDGFFYGRALA